jgi:HTH-type transcriptional regulator/antitoxin MqsA
MKVKKVVKPCQACEAGNLHYDVHDVKIARSGINAVVPNVAGWFCDSCEEIDFDENTDSGNRFAAAGDPLVLDVRKRVSDTLAVGKERLESHRG